MLPNNKKRQASWSILLILVMIVTMLSACGKEKDDVVASAEPGASIAPGASAGPAATPGHKDKDIAAVYKGGQVTYGDLNKFIAVSVFSDPQVAQYKDIPEYQEETLKRIITFRLISATASEKAKTEGSKAVKDQMATLKALTGDQKTQFETALKEANLKSEDLEAFITLQAVPQFEMVSRVTDKEAQDFYDKVLKENPTSLITATLNHILIATKDPADQTGVKELRTKDEALKLATDVKDQLTKGGDFATLAKKYTDDAGSKESGGQYVDAEISKFVAEFRDAAATLPLNTISDPIATEFGYHIMKVESRKTKTLAEIKEPIKQSLASDLLQKFMLEELPKNEYKSNIPTPVPTPVATPAPSTEASPSATPVK
ncbi:peptidylprolyl isomerase [Paenibacillus psychroresistens]|nr:peptidylprolyl isomerase [Paenibacillus psychroresistens]